MSLSLDSVYHTMEQTIHSTPQGASLILIEEAFLILILIGEANFIFILILIFTNANAYPLSLSLSRFLHLYSHNGGFLCSHCHSRQLSVVSVPCLLKKKTLSTPVSPFSDYSALVYSRTLSNPYTQFGPVYFRDPQSIYFSLCGTPDSL